MPGVFSVVVLWLPCFGLSGCAYVQVFLVSGTEGVCAFACCACYIYYTCVFAGRLAQPVVVFSSNDLQLIQQAVAANLSAYFLKFVNSHIPEDTPTRSELAQLCKYANQGSDVHHS